MPDTPSAQVARFGPFEADFTSGELRKHGLKLKISGQPISILEMLVEAPGQLVTRDQIRERLWPGNTFVDFDHSLNAAVNKLREALGDSADSPTYIETVPRRGYRFIGQLCAADGTAEARVPVTSLSPKTRGHIGWILGFSVAALLAVAAVFLFLVEKRKIPIALPGTSRVTIAVLPFDNLSGDPAQEYFSDGITEELSTQLARLNPSRLGVIARVTAFRYKKSSKSIQEIANELGVQYLLEGSVRHDGDRVRITTQLIRASDQTHIWAQNYDRDLKDILALQSEVSESVAREVGLHVGEGIARPKPVDPWHYRAYLLAKSLAAHGNYRSAVEQLTDVAAKNPNDPEVWSSIGLVYLNIAGRFAPQKPAMTKAREAVNRALALDPNAIHPIAVNAAIKFYYDYDFQGAEAGFQRALEIDPDDATINFPYAMLLSASGRREEARKQAERLSLLEPASEQFACSRARIDYYGGRSEAVVADLDRTHPNNPSVLVTCYWFALAALQKQRTAEPLAAAERLAAIDFPEQQGIAAYLYGKLGKRQEAMDVLKKMEDRRARGEWISSYNLAQAHLGLGNYDRALDLLEQAANEPSGMLVYLKCDPMYEPLRSNPRFTALMRKVHIPGL